MKKRTTILAILLAVATLATASLLAAGPNRRGPNAGGGAGMGIIGRLGHLREELSLSEQQTDRIRVIYAELHEQNGQAREQLREGRTSIADTLLDNPSDVASAQKVLDQQTAAESTLKANVLNATAKAIAVLTPEQREKLRTILAERAQRREHRRR